MKNKFLLLATALIFSTTTAFAVNPGSLANSGVVTPATETKSDMYEQIRVYMESYDIAIVYVCPEQGTTNYFAKDTYGIWYLVYVSEAGIVGGGYMQVDY